MYRLNYCDMNDENFFVICSVIGKWLKWENFWIIYFFCICWIKIIYKNFVRVKFNIFEWIKIILNMLIDG